MSKTEAGWSSVVAAAALWSNRFICSRLGWNVERAKPGKFVSCRWEVCGFRTSQRERVSSEEMLRESTRCARVGHDLIYDINMSGMYCGKWHFIPRH